MRGRYAVLDRAPGGTPLATDLLDGALALSFRYLGSDGAWRSTWPPSECAAARCKLTSCCRARSSSVSRRTMSASFAASWNCRRHFRSVAAVDALPNGAAEEGRG